MKPHYAVVIVRDQHQLSLLERLALATKKRSMTLSWSHCFVRLGAKS